MPERSITSSPALQGERVAFTGTLASMTHRDAAQLVEEHGGASTSGVSSQTTLLVIGEEGWPLEENGHPSQKLAQAEALQSGGGSIRVLSESEFLHLTGLADRPAANRCYTPAMLSQLLHVPVGKIRRWERLGLIRAVRRVHRLPYFEYQEVASARRLSQLLDEGVSPRRLEASLTGLARSLAGTDRPLAQLEILLQDAQLVFRDDRGLIRAGTRQRLLDFDTDDQPNESEADALPFPTSTQSPEQPSADPRIDWSADEWFHEGCRLADEGDADGAVEALRLALTADGRAQRRADEARAAGHTSATREGPLHQAEISFHLADALYRAGREEAAIERLYCAVEQDPEYLEAWTQLGCLLVQRESVQAGIDAFRIALDIHPDYPDANLHMGDACQQAGDAAEAREYWARYLEFDQRGPWAEHARQRLAATNSDNQPRAITDT